MMAAAQGDVEADARGDEAAGRLAQALAARNAGQLALAVSLCEQALALDAQRADAWLLKGVLARQAGDAAAAIAAYQQALALWPEYADAYMNLGNALDALGDRAGAIEAYRRCVAIEPRHAVALKNLGNLLVGVNRLVEAIDVLRRSVSLQPDLAEAWNNLGCALGYAGWVDEAMVAFRRGTELEPGNVAAHGNLLTILHSRPEETAASLLTAHRRWQEIVAAGLPRHRPDNDRDPARRLRIGYVSWNLRRDAAGCFISTVFGHHDRARFQVHAYCDNPQQDEATTTMRRQADVWVDSFGLADDELFARIVADRIDILVDLTGHTGRSRLRVFARKPAPVQLSWIGYEGTTGLDAMDWLIADRHVLPPGAEAQCSEQILRLPFGFQCYTPPADSPAVAPPPCLTRGYITFGSFNKPAKLNGEVIRLWSDLLAAVPASRLLLKGAAYGEAAIAERFRQAFAACGIGAERLEFRPASPYRDMLAEYGDIDIALDPFPFAGGATTCDALWMGVPLVTRRGERFSANHGVAHLAAAGFPEWIAESSADYLRIAAALAGDRPRLGETRAAQRPLVAASPLCDGALYMGHVELRLREIWQQWCRSN